MLTRIQVIGDADAVFDTDIGFLDFYPKVDLSDYPSAIAYFRLKAREDYALDNQTSGGIDAVVLASGTPNVTYNGQSVNVAATTTLAVPGLVSAPYTVISVFPQVAAPAANICRAGWPSSSATTLTRTGLISTTTGYHRAYAKNTTNAAVSAGLAVDGGARDEFIAAVFDDTNDIIKVRRPRTDDEAETAFTTWNDPFTSYFSIIGQTGTSGNFSGAAEGYLTMVFNEALSSAQIDEIYARTKTALAGAATPIEI